MILIPVTLKESRRFVEKFHRHNKAPQGGLFSIGLSRGGYLVGVAIVGRPVARMYQDGVTAEVTRVCVKEGIKNANSKLYAACWRAWRAMGGKRLVTYTLASESGSSLKGAGWKMIGEVRPRGKDQAWKGPDRDREWQEVYGQLKFRWEKQV